MAGRAYLSCGTLQANLTGQGSLDALPDDTAPLFAGTMFDQRFWYGTMIDNGLTAD